MRIVLLCLLLSGCAELIANAPSFQYCNEVRYTRTGNQIEVYAQCAAPLGGSSLPIPTLLK